MKALINFKICDNAKECGGIAICPTGAMHYDEEKQTIVIDDSCINCGVCEKECPVGAIMVAKDETQYQQYIEDINNDPRTIKDLFVDRYGAASLSEFFLIGEENIDEIVKKGKLTFIEVFNNDEAACLLKSIPIKEITDNINEEVSYYKVETNDEILKKYNIDEVPALLIFKNGALLGKIEGYFEISDKNEFENKVTEIVNKAN